MDSPGIGESGAMHYVDRYLGKSFGFIYVINSANAGGIQKGRVGNICIRILLLHAVRNFIKFILIRTAF